MKKIVVLGSTGSIGVQVLELVAEYPGEFKLLGISGNKNTKLLEQQIYQYKPQYVALADSKEAKRLSRLFKQTTFLDGSDCLEKLVSIAEVEMVCVAVVGVVALSATVKAIENKKDVAIATKEVLVAAGHIIMPLVTKMGTKLYPIDSEHVAVALCKKGYSESEIKNLYLTASGGPFLKTKNLKKVTLAMALKHPNWVMGRKISIDSATMINKGLEVIEAHWLFNKPYENIKVLVHPQSIVHGMVELVNGAYISQMGCADMKMPILYALSGGNILQYGSGICSFPNTSLEFFEPDLIKFKGLEIAYEVGLKGNSWPAVFNAANEEAVDLFIEGKIEYLDIINIIKKSLEYHEEIIAPNLSQVIEITRETRIKIKNEFRKTN